MRETIRKILNEARPSEINLSQDEVLTLLSKYEFLSDFAKQNPKIYDKYRRMNWFKNAALKLIKKSVRKGEKGFTEWTNDKVTQESQKYSTRKEFRTKSPLAYRWALDYNLFGKTINHLGSTQDRKPAGFWDYEKLKAEAFKYKTKKEFTEKNLGAVSTAKKMGIWDEITSHMQILGSLNRRAVYAWEFPDMSVYVGLTYNLELRGLSHLDVNGKTQVSKHIRLTKTTPIFKLISDYVSPVEAQNLEACTIEDYRNKGWKILNKAKAGGLGTCRRKWTDEAIKKEAEKYDNVQDFKQNSYSAYVLAQKYGIFDEVTKNMRRQNKKNYTEDEIRKVASQYNRKDLFLKNEPKIVHAARKKGIYDDLIKDMEKSDYDTSNYVPPTNDEVLTIAKQFSSMQSFRNQHPNLYVFASKNNLLPQIRDFYGQKYTRWDLEKLKDVSKKYISRFDFKKGNSSAYQSARRQGYLDILFPPED